MRYLLEGSTYTSTTLAATTALSASTTTSAHWGPIRHTLIVIEVLFVWHVAAKRTIAKFIRLMTLFYSLRLKHILLKTVQVMAEPTWKKHPTLVALDLTISVEVMARFCDFLDQMLVEGLWWRLFLLVLDPAFVMLIVQRASLRCSRRCENICSSELWHGGTRWCRWGVKTAAFLNRCRSCWCFAYGVRASPQKAKGSSVNTWSHHLLHSSSFRRNRPPWFESRSPWATSPTLICFLGTTIPSNFQWIWVLEQSQAV